jgi:hypothetical protein
MHLSSYALFGARGGGIGSIVGWFIRVVIYDICITGISEILGVPRLVALFIFLGILAAIAIGGYFLKQRYAPGVED